ncbi:MAG: hypothetical protein ABFQ53_00070 [Patescibacteria group bacterium]
MNIFQVAKCVKDLNSCLPLQNDASLKAATIQFNAGVYTECIREIKERMQISCTLLVAHTDTYFNGKNALAEIRVSQDMPSYGTKAFKEHSIKLIVSYELRNHGAITYIRGIAHEMSHIVLYSLQNKYEESEIATDITSMLLGFSQATRESRSNAGYLNGVNFWTAYILIKILQLKKNTLDKIKK